VSPVIGPGEGGEGVGGADWLSRLGPLGHLQQVGGLGAGSDGVTGQVLSLRRREGQLVLGDGAHETQQARCVCVCV